MIAKNQTISLMHGRRKGFFQGGTSEFFQKIFYGGQKWWNVFFPTRNSENNLFLLRFSKSRGGLPPFDAVISLL